MDFFETVTGFLQGDTLLCTESFLYVLKGFEASDRPTQLSENLGIYI